MHSSSPRRNREARRSAAVHENLGRPHPMQTHVIKPEADEDYGATTSTSGFATFHALNEPQLVPSLASCPGEPSILEWSAPLMFSIPPPRPDEATCSFEFASVNSSPNGPTLLDPQRRADLTNAPDYYYQDPSSHAIEMFSAWFPAPPTEESLVDLSLFDMVAPPNGLLDAPNFHPETPFPLPILDPETSAVHPITPTSNDTSAAMAMSLPAQQQHNLCVTTTALFANDHEFLTPPHNNMWIPPVHPPFFHHQQANHPVFENGSCNNNNNNQQAPVFHPGNELSVGQSTCDANSEPNSTQRWEASECSLGGHGRNALPSTSTRARASNMATPCESIGLVPRALKTNNTVSCHLSSRSCSSTSPPEAQLCLLTTLNDCYWKNGRKNLQCFPLCPEHHDFYSMKINNRKHSSAGVCRGPIHCQMVRRLSPSCANATAMVGHQFQPPPSSSSLHAMKEEFFVLGRFERVYQNEKLLNQRQVVVHGGGGTGAGEDHEQLDRLAPHDGDQFGHLANFTNFTDFDAFRQSCFQAVEMVDERRVQHDLEFSTWFFLPDVWKVQPMLKKKRKATRSMPARTYPFCFRVFAYKRVLVAAAAAAVDAVDTTQGPSHPLGHQSSDGNQPPQLCHFHCVAVCNSTYFELYSTRTVDRVKLKVHSAHAITPTRRSRSR